MRLRHEIEQLKLEVQATQIREAIVLVTTRDHLQVMKRTVGLPGEIIQLERDGTLRVNVCLITCPLSHHQGKTLGMAVIWGFCSTPCWWIALTYRDLVRSARNANKAQRDAARRIQAGA